MVLSLTLLMKGPFHMIYVARTSVNENYDRIAPNSSVIQHVPLIYLYDNGGHIFGGIVVGKVNVVWITANFF